MLINLTNHPQETWSENMINTAKAQYITIKDIPFPDIDPNANEEDIDKLALQFYSELKEVLNTSNEKSNAILVMGEFTFTYKIIRLLKNRNYKCISATARRDTFQLSKSEKKSLFQFVRFREYL